MTGWEKFVACLPGPPAYAFDFEAMADTPVGPLLRAMGETPQNPACHGEGDVLAHTKLVCERLCGMAEFRALGGGQRIALAAAAVLHDIGKIRTTRMEDGRLTSPGHSTTGAHMARELLWREFGLCGDGEKQALRETICLLVRRHMTPPHALESGEPERRLIALAAEGRLAKGFSMRLLCLLSLADALGRMADDVQEMAQAVLLCREACEEAGCLDAPLGFPSDYAQHAYLSGRGVTPGQPLYDDTWGEVVLMSGLPGTGKDTYIKAHYPGWPVVSLDALRVEMGVDPQDNQGRVAQAAAQRAREHLRAHRPFIWNATAVTPMMRGRQIRLFESYGAAVRIVYLETGWDEQLVRNAGRSAAVPESVIGKLLGTLIPPSVSEAQRVEWICV